VSARTSGAIIATSKSSSRINGSRSFALGARAIEAQWRDVFADIEKGIDDAFEVLGEDGIRSRDALDIQPAPGAWKVLMPQGQRGARRGARAGRRTPRLSGCTEAGGQHRRENPVRKCVCEFMSVRCLATSLCPSTQRPDF